jgi:hypothetical protein
MLFLRNPKKSDCHLLTNYDPNPKSHSLVFIDPRLLDRAGGGLALARKLAAATWTRAANSIRDSISDAGHVDT